MSLLSLFRFPWKKGDPVELDADLGRHPSSQDTLAAINELSKAVKNDPDAVEIYLALGNLYRSQGEIERAVQIRNSLIVRPSLDNRFKAKAWFELGRDYKRGGFYDRALTAFDKAETILRGNMAIIRELAFLAAETGDYERAAKHFSQIGQTQAQAHYLARLGEQEHATGDQATGKRWLAKAIKVSPSSPEAWLVRVKQAYGNQDWKKLERAFRDGLQAMAPELRFLLLDVLLAYEDPIFDANDCSQRTSCTLEREPAWMNDAYKPSDELKRLATLVIPLLEEQEPDVVLTYYGARLLAAAGDHDKTEFWFERAVLLDTNFWPARLGLMSLNLENQSLDSSFSIQLSFFIRKGYETKRFVCSCCGLKRSQLFFTCPRCRSWHSISFRKLLQD